MPNLRTMVTELGTGMGMLGHDDLDEVLRARPAVMRSLSPEDWDRLSAVRAGGAYDTEFHAAWLNGRAFLAARDGLRGRRPEVVEWKGAVRGSGDEVAPVDLRIDHVYLVSCKYMSEILFNASPTHVFDFLLVGGPARRGRGWEATGTPRLPPPSTSGSTGGPRGRARRRHGRAGCGPATAGCRQAALDTAALPGFEGTDPMGTRARSARHSRAALRDLPARAADLTSAHRTALGERLRAGWPEEAGDAYRALSDEVAQASVCPVAVPSRSAPAPERPCCGGSCGWAVPRTSSWVPA